MKKEVLKLAIFALLAWSVGAQAQTTYHVNRSFGNGSIVGTIETDCTIGALSPGNILSWSFDAFDGTDSVSISSASGGLLGDAWGYLSATPSELRFDFDGAEGDPAVQLIGFNGGEATPEPYSFDYNLVGSEIGKFEQLVHQFGESGLHRVDSPTRFGNVVIARSVECGEPSVSMGEVVAGLQAALTGGIHTDFGQPEGFVGAVNEEDRRGFIVPEFGSSSVQCDNDHILIGEYFATPLDRWTSRREAREYVNSLFGGRFVDYYFEIDGNRVDHFQTGTKFGSFPSGRKIAFFNTGVVIKPYTLAPGPHTASIVLIVDPGRDGQPPFFDWRLTADFTIVESSAATP